MAKKRGCCCLQSLISIIVVVALAVVGVNFALSKCSLSTFGITEINGVSLGELATLPLKELVNAVGDLSSGVKEEEVVDNPYNREEAKQEIESTLGSGSGATVGGEAITEDTVSGIITDPVIYPELKQITLADGTLAELFNMLIRSGESEEGIGAFADRLDIPQVELLAEGEGITLKAILKLQVGDLKSQIPGGGLLIQADSLYLTASVPVQAVWEEDSSAIVRAEGGAFLKVNDMNAEMSKTVLSALFTVLSSGEEALDEEQLLTGMTQLFSTVVCNLGRIGYIEEVEGVPTYAFASSALRAHAVDLVSHVA